MNESFDIQPGDLLYGGGKRLSLAGFRRLSRLHTSYKIPIDKGVTNRHIAKIGMHLTTPYFINASAIHHFDKQAAVMLRLNDNDLTNWVDSLN